MKEHTTPPHTLEQRCDRLGGDLCPYLEPQFVNTVRSTTKMPYKNRPSRPGKPLQHNAVLDKWTLLSPQCHMQTTIPSLGSSFCAFWLFWSSIKHRQVPVPYIRYRPAASQMAHVYHTGYALILLAFDFVHLMQHTTTHKQQTRPARMHVLVCAIELTHVLQGRASSLRPKNRWLPSQHCRLYLCKAYLLPVQVSYHECPCFFVNLSWYSTWLIFVDFDRTQ